MKWYKCSEQMPGKEDDYVYNIELSEFTNSGFLVCYNHMSEECYLEQDCYLARAYLENGKFVIAEYCHSYEECPDSDQKEYWEECYVTHWAHLYWPDDII